MTRQTLLPVLVSAGLLWTAAAAPQFEPETRGVIVDEIVARVNGEIILKSDIDQQQELMRQELIDERRTPAEIETAIRESAPDLLRNLIDESLLTQKAGEYGLDSDADLAVLRTMDQIRQQNGFETIEDLESAILSQGDSPEMLRERIRADYLSQQVINREVRSRIVITNEELRTYYEANQSQFERAPGVSIAEIVKFVAGLGPAEQDIVRAEMERILDRLRDGEDFAEIAAVESETASAVNGGVLEYREDGTLSTEYEAAVEGLARNQVSEIFAVSDVTTGSEVALVIVRLLERHPGGILSFGLARPMLEQAIMTQKDQPRIRDYLARLRSESFVEIRPGYVDTGATDEEGAEAPDDGETIGSAGPRDEPAGDAVD